MKLVHYKPLSGQPSVPPPPDTLPVEALSEVIFRSASLEEALEALKREGYRDPAGNTIVAGIAHLLESLKALRENLSAAGDPGEPHAAGDEGPVKSGAARKKSGARKSSRIIPDSPAGRRPAGFPQGYRLTRDDLAQIEHLEKTLRRVYWGYDPGSIDEELLEKILGGEALRSWQAIKELVATAFRQGLAAGTGSGLRLTTAALHKIARNILKNIFKPARREPRARRSSPHQGGEIFLSIYPAALLRANSFRVSSFCLTRRSIFIIVPQH